MGNHVQTRAHNRVEEILDAAEALFTQKGYDGTSIKDIIDAVGIARGTLYHHFSSKLDVLDAVVQRRSRAILASFEPLIDDPTLDAPTKLRQLFMQGNQWKVEHREFILSIAEVMYRPENAIWRERIYRTALEMETPLLVAIIRQGITEGHFDVDDPEATAPIVLTMAREFGDTFARALLANDQSPDTIQWLYRKARAYEQSLERVLGMVTGTLRLNLETIVAAWFPDDLPETR
nr:TetR/AcrR family transcriptional regulator [Ardenticatena sp.]